MRYFFHIVDRHGLFPDGTGYEYPDQDAAVLHATRIASELARAGEFFRSSFVLIARVPPSGSMVRHDRIATLPFRDA